MWRRLTALGLAGGAVVAYVAVRPGIAAQNPYLHLAEFPIAVALLGLILLATLRPPRDERRRAIVDWRRHEQKVRQLPDPEAARLRAPLDAWVQDGARHEDAASVVARASGADADDALRARMADLRTKRARAAFLRSISKGLDTTRPGA